MAKRHDHIAFPWLSLPADICLLVLDEISGQKHRGWAQCAAVCKEWQAILEPKIFSQLAIGAVLSRRPGNTRYPTKTSCPGTFVSISAFLDTPVPLVLRSTPCPLTNLPFLGGLF